MDQDLLSLKLYFLLFLFSAYVSFIINSQTNTNKMYANFQFYNPIVATQTFPMLSGINSFQLLQSLNQNNLVISVALDRNINAFVGKITKQTNKSEENDSQLVANSKLTQPHQVFAQNDGKKNNNFPQNFRQIQQSNSKYSTSPQVHQTLLESNEKPQIVHSEPQSNISCQEKQKQEFQFSLGTQSELKKKTAGTIGDDFFQFTIKVPQLGLCSSEILKRKQKLLRRNIGDWSQLGKQAKKKRRQMKMLFN